METDVEHVAEARAAATRPRPGTSILSTLLALYDSANASSTASLRHARSFDDSRPTSLYESTTNESIGDLRLDGPVPATPPASSKKTQRSWKMPFTHRNRPEREPTLREPGVFGALVASTNNLSGAAAPTSSTIAPSLKRPGYHLSR